MPILFGGEDRQMEELARDFGLGADDRRVDLSIAQERQHACVRPDDLVIRRGGLADRQRQPIETNPMPEVVGPYKADMVQSIPVVTCIKQPAEPALGENKPKTTYSVYREHEKEPKEHGESGNGD